MGNGLAYGVASLCLGWIAVWAGENLFWTTPAPDLRLPDLMFTLGAYSVAAGAALSAVLWSGLRGWRAAFLGGALLGFDRGRRRRHDVRGLSRPAGLDAAGLACAGQRAVRAGGRAGAGAGRRGTSGCGAAGAGRLRRGLGALLADRGQGAGRVGRDGGLSGPLRGGGGAGARGAVAAGAHGGGPLVAVAGAGGHRGALGPGNAGRAHAPAAGGAGDGGGDALGDAAAGAGWRGAGLRPAGALGARCAGPAGTGRDGGAGHPRLGRVRRPLHQHSRRAATGAVSLGLWLWLMWRAFRRPSAARPPA